MIGCMKKLQLLLPFAVLVAAVLGCSVPRSSGTGTPSSPARSEPAPRLLYGKPSIESLGSAGGIVHVQVTNASDKTLQFVQAHMAFYDKDGNMITSQNGYCENQSLKPGGKAAVKIMIDRDKRVKRYELTFSAQVDGSYGDIELDAVAQ